MYVAVTGASPVDFPGVHRVDHLNGSDVSRVLQLVADRYEEELDRPGNKEFLRYITSMWSEPDLVLSRKLPFNFKYVCVGVYVYVFICAYER